MKWATGHVDVDPWASHGIRATRMKSQKLYRTRLTTCNVRGLNQAGKLHILSNELTHYKIDIADISNHIGKAESSTSQIIIQSTTLEQKIEKFIHSFIHGVGFIVSNIIYGSVIGYETINERLISIKINYLLCVINIQVYIPTSDADEELIEEFYGTLEVKINKLPRKEMLILMGDFNAKVGSTTNVYHIGTVVGKYGLGEGNERGERLLQFCIDNDFTITNTVSNQHTRKLNSCRSP